MRSSRSPFGRPNAPTFVEHNTPGGTCRIPIRSTRAAEVARWFGLDHRLRRPVRLHARTDPFALLPLPKLSLDAGTLTLVSGASGSGKSSLLRHTHERLVSPERTWIDLAQIALPDVPLVDCFGDTIELEAVLMLLSRVGLGEAWSYLRTPAELSDGQRWRLRLAMGLHLSSTSKETSPVIVADEFCALLDRVTAYVVAQCLRKSLNAMPHLAALVATSHDDLLPALQPDVHVRCEFGRITGA